MTTNVTNFGCSAKKRGGQRAPGDLADLQAHEAGQEGYALKSENPPAQVSPRHICVRCYTTIKSHICVRFKDHFYATKVYL